MSEARGILETLKEVRRGALLDDLQVALRELVTAVRATGGKGSLVITLRVQPVSKADGDTVMLDDAIKVNKPKAATAATVLYATPEGELTRKDPRQPELAGLRVPAAVAHLVPAHGEAVHHE